MRRITLLYSLLMLLTLLPSVAFAQDDVTATAAGQTDKAFAQSSKSQVASEPLQLFQPSTSLKALKGELKALPNSKQTAKAKPSVRRVVKRIISAADLTGKYVWTANSFVTGHDEGCAVTITALGNDSIVISRLGAVESTVKAKVDAAAGKIYIPNQVVLNDSTLGAIDITTFDIVNNKAVMRRDKAITGTILSSGQFTIDDDWGLFTSDDRYVGVYSGSDIDKANGRLTFTTTDGAYYVDVYINQKSSNLVTVKNFAGRGHEVEIVLQRDSSATIAQQEAMYDAAQYGAFYTVGVANPDTTPVNTNFLATITCPKASNNKQITWGAWSLLSQSAYVGYRLSGTLQYNDASATFTYPKLTATEFKGSGTAADPYQLRTLDDLVLLSDKANYWEATDPVGNTAYHRSYKGIHFKVMNDIDMHNYRFTPITHAYYYVFAGSVDGGGHTLSNLNINNPGYAALFGRTDTTSVIENLNIDKATVKSTSNFNAALVGWSNGTVRNINVTNSTVYGEGIANGGIVGSAVNISNSTIENTSVSSLYAYTGGIAGEITGSIENCHATHSDVVSGGSEMGPVGGIVGNLSGATAKRLYYTGIVRATSSNLFVGGVLGRAVNSTADQLFAKAFVRGMDSKAAVGGVSGALVGATLTNSYSTSKVYDPSSRFAGGIVGRLMVYTSNNVSTQPAVKNSYAAGTLSAETYQYKEDSEIREVIGTVDDDVTPTLSNLYYDNQLVNFNSTHYGVPTSTLTAAAGPAGFDASVWTFTAGAYPQLTFAANTEASKYSASAFTLAEGNSLANVAKPISLTALGSTKFRVLTADGKTSDTSTCLRIVGNQIQLTGEYGIDSLYIINGKDSLSYGLKAAPVTLDGAGTETNPYQIKTKADMIYLADLTTNKELYFPGTYFKVMNDIDMENDTTFHGIANLPDDAHARFAGVLDGGGHTLHHLYLTNYVVWEDEPSNHFGDGTGTPANLKSKGWNGLVARLETTGVIKNLNIAADSKFEFFATAGPFVGDNFGLVENCRNYADVTAISCWAGGIVGRNEMEGTVRNCYNAGDITSGYMQAGGIAGTNSGTIDASMNVGFVSVKQASLFIDASSTRGRQRLRYAGGITGYTQSGLIKNCLNAGTVYSFTNCAGGISGNMYKSSTTTEAGLDDILNCINYGAVLTDDQSQIGGISGVDESEGTIADNYWDAQVLPLKAAGGKSVNGCTGATTAELTSGKALANYADSLWSFEAGKYPVLKAFKDEPVANVARQIIPNIASGENAFEVNSDFTLSAPAGTQWFLLSNKSFKFKDATTVSVPKASDVVATDTLVAVNGNYIKPIILKHRYPMPVAGDGTKANPYLITNANEWNAVAKYMADCGEDFQGKYVKIGKDIDFANVAFSPMGYDDVTFINGDFDGGNHTVSNISMNGSVNTKGEGAFRTIGENANVHNLTLEGTMTSSFTYASGFAGSVYGTVDSCVNEIAVTSTKSYTSGFAAYAYETSKFIDCVNRADVSSSQSYVAGFVANVKQGASFLRCGNEGTVSQTGTANYIAGFAASSLPATYVGVYNKGDISVANTNNTSFAAGLITNASGTGDLVLNNCYNTANVTAKATVAGILTTASSASKLVMKFDSCYNTGNITAASTTSASSSPTAGISSFYTPGSVITNCWNSGDITSNKNVYAAGIVANNTGTATASTPVLIANCHNTGNIAANGNQGGGIVAYTHRFLTVDHCWNSGDITGGFGLGGIMACLQGDTTTTVTNCYNTGNIITSTNRAGGLIGYGVAAGTVQNCFNVGDVSTILTEGGTKASTSGYAIGGLAGTSGGHFIDCYNIGTVSGASQVGGLVGTPRSGYTAFVNCYNAGKIDAPADTCGAIIGVNPEYGRVWNDDNVVTNTWYVTDYGTYDNVVGDSTTLAKLTTNEFGSNWTHPDNYSLPVLTYTADSSFVKFWAAVPVPADGDTYNSITKNFFVGVPEGISWTATPAKVTIVGNNAKFTDSYNGELLLTATMGQLSKQFKLNCNVTTTGIGRIGANGKEIASEAYYTVSGMQVAQPRHGDVYILKRTYTDGSSDTVKIAR